MINRIPRVTALVFFFLFYCMCAASARNLESSRNFIMRYDAYRPYANYIELFHNMILMHGDPISPFIGVLRLDAYEYEHGNRSGSSVPAGNTYLKISKQMKKLYQEQGKSYLRRTIEQYQMTTKSVLEMEKLCREFCKICLTRATSILNIIEHAQNVLANDGKNIFTEDNYRSIAEEYHRAFQEYNFYFRPGMYYGKEELASYSYLDALQKIFESSYILGHSYFMKGLRRDNKLPSQVFMALYKSWDAFNVLTYTTLEKSLLKEDASTLNHLRKELVSLINIQNVYSKKSSIALKAMYSFLHDGGFVPILLNICQKIYGVSHSNAEKKLNPFALEEFFVIIPRLEYEFFSKIPIFFLQYWFNRIVDSEEIVVHSKQTVPPQQKSKKEKSKQPKAFQKKANSFSKPSSKTVFIKSDIPQESLVALFSSDSVSSDETLCISRKALKHIHDRIALFELSGDELDTLDKEDSRSYKAHVLPLALCNIKPEHAIALRHPEDTVPRTRYAFVASVYRDGIWSHGIITTARDDYQNVWYHLAFKEFTPTVKHLLGQGIELHDPERQSYESIVLKLQELNDALAQEALEKATDVAYTYQALDGSVLQKALIDKNRVKVMVFGLVNSVDNKHIPTVIIYV